MVQGRKVIHYMQPHIPYLDLKENSPDNISSQDGTVRDRTKGRGINVLEILGRKIAELIGTEPLWRLKRELGLPPTDTMESAWRREISADAYLNNLLRALKSVRRLVESADGRIVVTADHGECLGEQNCWGHGAGRVRSPLVEVPWLEVK